MDFTFELEKYCRIETSSEEFKDGIIFIHDICCELAQDGREMYYILVSKYSFLKSADPFSSLHTMHDSAPSISDNEVVLHFESFEKMGYKEDAEFLCIDNISRAYEVERESNGRANVIRYVFGRPPSKSSGFPRL